ncbi:MAG: hypothetical protein ACXVPQ_12710 [Bacteroidia bacterium]
MKKIILTVSLLSFIASTAVMAQDDKKQEPKKEEKKEEKPKTRMAINEKGLPGNGTKQGNGSSNQKSSGTGTTSGTSKKEDHK